MEPARLRGGALPEVAPASEPESAGGAAAWSNGDGWSIEEAEDTLRELDGVISARVVARPGGGVQEIHLLTPDDVPPKKTVRRVESAFLTQFGFKIDHRKVSVAQSRWPIGDKGKKAKSSASFLREPTSLAVGRPTHTSAGPRQELSFGGHQVKFQSSGRVHVRVFLEADGRRFSGDAKGSSRARSRMTTLASATLRAIEASLEDGTELEQVSGSFLTLENVDVVDAFQRDYVLAAVSGTSKGEAASVAGAAPVEESLDRAVILSTLQAATRWITSKRITEPRASA
jgi:hypothetical protein